MELLLLGLVAGIGVISYSLLQRERTFSRPRPLERTLATLQVGDVVQCVGGDYLVEAAFLLMDEGRAGRLYRLTEGRQELFLFLSVPSAEPLLLERSSVPVPEGRPPSLESGGERYRLFARHRRAVLGVGDMRLGAGRDHVTILEYAGAASGRLLLFDWEGEKFDLLEGRVALPQSFEVLSRR
jgi:hypothetical protein